MSKSLELLTVSPAVEQVRQCCAAVDGSPLNREQALELAPMFKALGDPVRLQLLSMIAASGGAGACVCDLSEAFDLTQPTISHHLKVLRETGLVDSERRGSWVYYWIRPDVLTGMATLLQGVPASA